MRVFRLALASVVFLVAGAFAQTPDDADRQRSAWRFRRTLHVVEPGIFMALDVPPEVAAQSRADLRDLRLVDSEGTELSYFIDPVLSREWNQIHSGRLVDLRSEPVGAPDERRGTNEWVVDLGETRSFDTIALTIPGSDFSKHFRVEGSNDRSTWEVLGRDVPIFEGNWAGRIRHTTIPLGAAVAHRYLRLSTPDDRRSRRVGVSGVSVSSTKRAESEVWRLPVTLEVEEDAPDSHSRYRLDLPEGFPFDTATLNSDDPAFARRVSLIEVEQGAVQGEERRLGEATLYRLSLPDERLAVDQRVLRLGAQPTRGQLMLEVEDADSPPLHNPRLEVRGIVRRLVFTPTGSALTLYYGNDATRGPVYDIARLKGRLRWSPGLGRAALGDLRDNPHFQRPAPFPFTPPRGAPVDVTRWKAVKLVAVGGSEDVFTLTLQPEDLGQLRSTLGDLRIVDAADAQVPFILAPRASEAQLPLSIERDPGRARGETGLSRYRVTVKDPHSGETITLPLASLELHFAEEFFERPVRLLEPGRDRQRGERVLHSAALSRRPAAPPTTDIELPSIVVSLSGHRASVLVLEINDGDNAPLTLQKVEAIVQVPRVVFKAAPGTYRLLLGNRDAEAPRYDLAALRREVLAYSALPVEAEVAVSNTAHRRSLGDYFKDAPTTLILWGALIAGVVVLLGLVARILRQQPAEDDPAAEG